MKLILMVTKSKNAVINKKNWNDKNQYKINTNAFIKSLIYYKTNNDMSCLKALLDHISDIKPFINYTNNKNETIYHYLLTKEICDFFKTKFKLSFGFKQFNKKNINNKTPFMLAISKGSYKKDLEFQEWILNDCCKNNDEKIKLIYEYDDDENNSLNLSMGNTK
eukprot:132838_1